jgi:hypothetical protein
MRSLALLTLAAASCGGSDNVSYDLAGCAGNETSFGSVCIKTPGVAAARTPCGNGVTEFCDKTNTDKPNLTCLTGMPKMHPPTPAAVTLTGFVHPFSSGSSNAPVLIEIYKAASLTPGSAPDPKTAVATAMVTFDPTKAMDPTQFRACDRDPKVGCIAVTPDACMVPACNDGLAGRRDDGKFCATINGAPGTCDDRLRWEPRFSIPGVPTNTSLVILAKGTDSVVWASLIAWNVFLATDDKSCGGDAQATDCLDTSNMAEPKYQLNVNTLSQSDYGLIPTTAGLSMGITPGQGAVAGEVHDCDNIRIANVMVGVSPAGDRLTYFNGNPYMTLPDSGRAATGTDRLSLYASLNVRPGKVDVEGAGLVDGKPVSVGKFTAIVYPASVAVINLNGGKPQQ